MPHVYQPVEKQAAPADASQWASAKAQEKFTFSVNAVAESWVKKAVSDFFTSLICDTVRLCMRKLGNERSM